MNIERLFARIFVLLGGLFWFAAATGADFAYQPGVTNPWLWLGVTVVALAVGWLFEYLAAALLGVGAVGVAVYGVVAGWEQGVWWIMGGMVASPMIIAALLFMLAARMQRICTMEEKGTAAPPSAPASLPGSSAVE